MHEIHYRTFPVKKTLGAIQKECDKDAVIYGDYHHKLDPPIRFKDKVCKTHEEAYNWIEQNDSGWYDSLAIKYKEGRKIFWLVKYEYHV